MSATISTDRAHLRIRGTLLAYIFANQGWGSLVGSLVTIIVLLCYKDVMEAGKTSKVDGGELILLLALWVALIHSESAVWRIAVGLSLIPALGTLYQRLTLPEAKRFKDSQNRNSQRDEEESEKTAPEKKGAMLSVDAPDSSEGGEKSVTPSETAPELQDQNIVESKRNHFRGK